MRNPIARNHTAQSNPRLRVILKILVQLRQQWTIPDQIQRQAGQFAPQRLERSPLVMAVLAVMLAGWIYTHFFVKNLSLNINSVNTIVLFHLL